MKNRTFVIEHVVRGRWGVLERERTIKYWAGATRESLKNFVWNFMVVIEVEPGSGGKESAEATIRNLADHACIGDKPGAGRSKQLRAEPFAARVQGGNVYLHAGPWIQDFLDEAESFPNSPYSDQVDAAAMAFHYLATEPGIPLKFTSGPTADASRQRPHHVAAACRSGDPAPPNDYRAAESD
jgi:predicted phage terminase large subunit-like protein